MKFQLKSESYIKGICDVYDTENNIFKVSPYPHTKLLKLDINGNLLQEYTTLQLVAINSNIFDGHNDLEVVYIGQAYGKKVREQQLKDSCQIYQMLKNYFLHQKKMTFIEIS